MPEKNITVLEQPPDSPDLAPCDFFLFPSLKGIIMGTRFEGVDGTQKAVTTELIGIQEESFQRRKAEKDGRVHLIRGGGIIL